MNPLQSFKPATLRLLPYPPYSIFLVHIPYTPSTSTSINHTLPPTSNPFPTKTVFIHKPTSLKLHLLFTFSFFHHHFSPHSPPQQTQTKNKNMIYPTSPSHLTIPHHHQYPSPSPSLSPPSHHPTSPSPSHLTITIKSRAVLA